MVPNSTINPSASKFDSGFRFDAESLLLPITDAAATGESLRYEGTYDNINEARTEDDATLSQGVWKTPIRKAQWSEVEALCLDALLKRSKDIQISAWLTEAWLHLHGFAGLREGLTVVTELCDRFWPDLHPRAESGDDLEYRLAPIEWMNEKLPPIVRLLPLTAPDSGDLSAYSWNDWESAARASANNGSASPAQLQQSAMMTPTALYSALLQVIESTAKACSQLEELLLKHCGDRAASLRQLANLLDQIKGFVVSSLNQREDREEPVRETMLHSRTSAQAVERDDASSPREISALAGPIRDRTEAYRRLAEAADYLARTEPHSPTPYLVRRAIAWGSLRLEELLPELIQNSSELGEIFRLLQIQKPSD